MLSMYGTMARLVDVLDSMADDHPVVLWACPVPFFGDISSAAVATVGINPSNREFVGLDGIRLSEGLRRLPTLESLGKRHWSDIDGSHVRTLLDECRTYFMRNPYDRWFGTLEGIISRIPASYYGRRPSACHLDLIPYATVAKWGSLDGPIRTELLETSQNALGELLRDSNISILVLNGAAVVRTFQALTGVTLDPSIREEWTLSRLKDQVTGYSYTGRVTRVGETEVGRSVRVLGYNHNLQSSFGVTTAAKTAISDWIASEVRS